MTRLTPIVLLLAFLTLAPAQARSLAGVELPDSAVVDGATLKLNGMGLRAATALRVKAYVGGPYLGNRTTPRPSSIRTSASV